jgi:hypothetical protein
MKVDGGLENRDENDFERLRISIQELFEDPGSSTSARHCPPPCSITWESNA